jgi:tRNA/rRNA methyltransferase
MTSLPNIRIICVRPLYGGNIGSICRAMQNCGLHQLVLVDPNPDLDRIELRKMALKALPIYKNRKEFSSVEAAVVDCGVLA